MDNQLTKKYQYLFFDFNGTIINDVELCLTILNKMLSSRGYQEVSYKRYKEIFTFPIINYYIEAGFDFNKHPFNDLANDFIMMYQKASLNCELYPEVITTLNKLKEKYHLILLSASQLSNLIEQTDNFNITKYFDTILGLDNIHAKSKLEIAQNYFNEYHINPKEALFIGDTVHDWEVGNALNSDVVLISAGHQSYEKLLTTKTLIIHEFKELLSYLLNE